MSPERLKKLTLQDGERRATLLTWRFTEVVEKRHPRAGSSPWRTDGTAVC